MHSTSGTDKSVPYGTYERTPVGVDAHIDPRADVGIRPYYIVNIKTLFLDISV